MKIVQILTHLNWGDAIGNEVMAMDEALKQQGYDARIMAITVHESLCEQAYEIDFSTITKEDLVIFHKATGDMLIKSIANLPCRKVMVYHNITPAKFFLPYDRIMAANLWLGRHQLRKFASCMDACWADSTFNAQELIRCGVQQQKTKVLPILFSEKETTIQPDLKTEQKLNQQKGTKLLCIGRIAPNKKLEDTIKLYVYYQRRYDKDAVLYLVGSWDGQEKYYAKLKGFCADLKLTDNQVVFTGRVTEEEKEAYLRNTDVLLCMSEHEGFCVPLLEAMKRNLPILAYAEAAVPETLGESELLFTKKEYEKMAEAVDRLQKDELFHTRILKEQRQSLKRFDSVKTRQQFIELVYGYSTDTEKKRIGITGDE